MFIYTPSQIQYQVILLIFISVHNHDINPATLKNALLSFFHYFITLFALPLNSPFSETIERGANKSHSIKIVFSPFVKSKTATKANTTNKLSPIIKSVALIDLIFHGELFQQMRLCPIIINYNLV